MLIPLVAAAVFTSGVMGAGWLSGNTVLVECTLQRGSRNLIDRPCCMAAKETAAFAGPSKCMKG